MPGLYLPNAGDTLTAANAITYWSKQVVIQCTSGTRPSSPVQGMVIFQTDTNTLAVYGTAWCEITPYGATVATSQTTASTSYADLATTGPAVTITTGTKAIVTVSGHLENNTTANLPIMGYAVSGATTIAAADTAAAIVGTMYVGTAYMQLSYTDYTAGLTAGANVLTAKYRVTGNTGTFSNRRLVGQAIPT